MNLKENSLTEASNSIVPTDFTSEPSCPSFVVSSTTSSLIDLSYSLFKSRLQISAGSEFKSVFWFDRKYKILVSERAERLIIKSEFYIDSIEEDCLAHFFKLDFLKQSVFDYTERVQENLTIIDIKMHNKLIGKLRDCTFIFKCYRSNGGFWVGKNSRSWDDEGMIDYLGFCTYGYGNKGKILVLGMLEVCNCDWIRKSSFINWFSEVADYMYEEMSK